MTGTAQRSGRRADRRRPRRRRAAAAPKWFPRAALRRLRPAHPRPAPTGRRRRLPSWRRLPGGPAASVGLAALSSGVAYAATDIPPNLNSYATQQDTVYFWSDGTPMAGGYATCAAAGKRTEPYSVRRITHNGAAIRLTTPTVSTATGKSGSPTDDTAAWYTGTAESVSTAVVVHRTDLPTSLEPLPLKGITGAPADSVPYAVCSGAMGLG